MKSFFYPESVIVVGVSDSPSNLGRVIVENMDRFGFQKEIHVVGRGKSLNGRKIVQSVEQVPPGPDLAILLLRADRIPEVLEACGRHGIQHVVVETGGFSEFRKDRSGLERKIKAIAEKWQIELMGPNCIGVMNFENGLIQPFVPFSKEKITFGPVSMISQSGGLIHNIFRRASLQNIGLNKMVSIGNKLMLGENELLDFLVHDPHTTIIGPLS